LAQNYAVDFFKEWSAGKGDYSFGKINDHHIFPKKVKEIDQEKGKTFDDTKDFIVNRTLLLDETNIQIKNKRPSRYIQDMVKKHGTEDKVKSILEKHLISEQAYQFMKDDDYDQFIIEREKTIKKHLISVLGIR